MSVILDRLDDLEAELGIEFDHEDRDDSQIEQCPICGTQLTGPGGSHGPVRDYRGRRSDHLLDTDPGDGPFFCASCYEETIDVARRQAENASLERWSA